MSDLKIQLDCSRAELNYALKQIRIGIPKRGKGSIPPSFEINIRPESAVLTTLGASYTIECTANGFAKVIAPYAIVADFAKRTKVERISMVFSPGLLEMAGSVFRSPSIHVVHPENQETLDLTLNHKDRDLILLRGRHSNEELQRIGLLKQVEQAEERMRERINQAAAQLAPYKISYDDLEELVHSRLNR